MRLAVDAASAGLPVRVEVCPHYLTLDTAVLSSLGPWAKCAPPLRDRGEVEALWDLMLAGKVDFVGSDHAPWEYAEKSAGIGNIWEAPNGLQSSAVHDRAYVGSG